MKYSAQTVHQLYIPTGDFMDIELLAAAMLIQKE